MNARSDDGRPGGGILRRPDVFVLALVAAVLAFRAPALLGRRNLLTAAGERRFFHWAYGGHDATLRPRLEALAPRLRFGDAVCVRADDPSRDWPRAIASYALPGQVVVVSSPKKRKDPPIPCRPPRLVFEAGPAPRPRGGAASDGARDR